MKVRKQQSGKWLFEKYLDGGRRIRKTFATKGEALAYENYIEEQTTVKPWITEKQDWRCLSDLIETWYLSHGKTLKDGERVKRILDFISESINDPVVDDFTKKVFTDYRKRRLNGELYRTDTVKTVSLRTLNLELVYIRAMFNELKRLGEWDRPNHLKTLNSLKLMNLKCFFYPMNKSNDYLTNVLKAKSIIY